MEVGSEAVTVEAVEPVFGAEPKVAMLVLVNSVNRFVGEPIALVQMTKAGRIVIQSVQGAWKWAQANKKVNEMKSFDERHIG